MAKNGHFTHFSHQHMYIIFNYENYEKICTSFTHHARASNTRRSTRDLPEAHCKLEKYPAALKPTIQHFLTLSASMNASSLNAKFAITNTNINVMTKTQMEIERHRYNYKAKTINTKI